MARDYYSLLERATAALDPNTAQARRAVYDRARHAIIDADLPTAELRNEQSALEAAIERIETETRATAAAGPVRRRSEMPPSADGAPAAPAGTVGSPGISRPALMIGALVAASIVIAGIAGYAFWPRGAADRSVASKEAGASGAKIDDAKSGSEPGDPKRSYIFNRQVVYYRSIHPVGTIVIAKSQRFLYLVRPNVAAIRYTTGIGHECATAVGLLLVSAKEQWPEVPPPAASARRPTKSGDNADGRFGARSLALSDTGHRIHGTYSPSIAGEDGCFPLVNDDIIDLHERVPVGTRVVIN